MDARVVSVSSHLTLLVVVTKPGWCAFLGEKEIPKSQAMSEDLGCRIVCYIYIIQWQSPSWNSSWHAVNQVGNFFQIWVSWVVQFLLGWYLTCIYVISWNWCSSSRCTVPPTSAQLHLEVWVCQPTHPPKCLAVPAARLGTKLQSPGPAILEVPMSKSSIGPPDHCEAFKNLTPESHSRRETWCRFQV